jgi:hypothetical protein
MDFTEPAWSWIQVQDDLSMQIAMINALSNDQVPKGISVFDPSGIRDYEFERVGAETLHTPVGDIETVIYRSHKAYSPRSNRRFFAGSSSSISLLASSRSHATIDSMSGSMRAAASRRRGSAWALPPDWSSA